MLTLKHILRLIRFRNGSWTMTTEQESLKAKHGTPEEFAAAVYACEMISGNEADAAVAKYDREWMEAGRSAPLPSKSLPLK